MADSTIPAAKAKLVELLTAALGDVGVLWVGPAQEADVSQDMVWLGDLEQTEAWHGLGAQKREESYLLDVYAQAYRQGDDPKNTELALLAIRDDVSTVLRAHKDLDGVLGGFGVASLERTRLDAPQLAEQGWVSRCLLQVRCTALI